MKTEFGWRIGQHILAFYRGFYNVKHKFSEVKDQNVNIRTE